jgi:glycosyltransferase involved in cell wall biosynthesis
MLTPWWENLLKKHAITKKSIISPNPNSAAYCQIAESYIEQPRQLQEKQSSFEILTMARLVEGKGVELVISALAQLPKQYHLTIAGDGPLKSQLQQQVKSLDLDDRITFAGWIDGDKKNDLLRRADVFCLPSTYDSFGMVFIEAMAFDLPVIAYGWGPIADVVNSEVGQCCVKPSTEEVLRCIKHVCSDLSAYSGKGPARVIDNYTPEAVAKNIIELLE